MEFNWGREDRGTDGVDRSFLWGVNRGNFNRTDLVIFITFFLFFIIILTEFIKNKMIQEDKENILDFKELSEEEKERYMEFL